MITARFIPPSAIPGYIGTRGVVVWEAVKGQGNGIYRVALFLCRRCSSGRNESGEDASFGWLHLV